MMALTESAWARIAVVVFGLVMHIIYHIATEKASRDAAVVSTMVALKEEAQQELNRRS
jgi:hypothetical protein